MSLPILCWQFKFSKDKLFHLLFIDSSLFYSSDYLRYKKEIKYYTLAFKLI